MTEGSAADRHPALTITAIALALALAAVVGPAVLFAVGWHWPGAVLFLLSVLLWPVLGLLALAWRRRSAA